MNTITILPERAGSIAIRQPRRVHYKIVIRKNLLERFRNFIETNDWESYLCNHWIDRACIGGIVVSMLYFLPILASIIQE